MSNDQENVEKNGGNLACHTPLSDHERVQTKAEAGLPVMVPLSVPEIRRLFFYLLEQPPLSRLFRLGWSFFRRTHQAIARRCHYKRRLSASP